MPRRHPCTAYSRATISVAELWPMCMVLVSQFASRCHCIASRAQQLRACTTANSTGGSTGQATVTKKVRVRSTVFRFKHFDLSHGNCAQKMGTDSMLLGAWAQPPPNSATLLDVGTGTGVLALMMAQKTQQHHSLIHAIDIDQKSYLQASENFQQSPWAHRLFVAQSSFQNWVRSCSTKYDMIITNPPYFLQSSKPGATSRAAARHADVLLPFNDLASGAAKLLQPTGRLCLILPVTEAQQFTAAATQHGLQLTRLMHVFTRSHDMKPRRHLMQFELKPIGSVLRGSSALSSSGSRSSSSSQTDFGGIERLTADTGATAEERLVVMEQRIDPVSGRAVHSYSQQYQQLTQDFHHPSMFQRGS